MRRSAGVAPAPRARPPGDIAERTVVPGSHEPPARALVRVTRDDVVVHTHGFLDGTAGFPL